MTRRCCCGGVQIPCATSAQIDPYCATIYPPQCFQQAICVQGETGSCLAVNSAPYGVTLTRTGALTFEFIETGIRKYTLVYDGALNFLQQITLESFRWDGAAWVLCRSIAFIIYSSNGYASANFGGGLIYKMWLLGTPLSTNMTVTTAGIVACEETYFLASGASFKITALTGINTTKILPLGFPILNFFTAECTWQAVQGSVSLDIWDASSDPDTDPPDAAATADIIWTLHGENPTLEISAKRGFPLLGPSFPLFFFRGSFGGLWAGTFPGDPCSGRTLGPLANFLNACGPDSQSEPMGNTGTATLIIPDHST